MSSLDDLNALDPAAHAVVTIGEGISEKRVVIRALRLGQLPGFARALQPLSEQVEEIIRTGLSASAVMRLVSDHFDQMIEALQIATGIERPDLEALTVERGLEVVLAVLGANRDFLRGRAATALRTAAGGLGAGPTPSKGSSARAGASTKSRT